MSIYTKSDWSRAIVLRSRATREPLNLAGWTLEMVIKGKRADTAALLTLSTENGGLVIDSATPGRIIIQLTAAQSNCIGAGDRIFAVYRTDGGRRLNILTGRMAVLEGV